MDRAVISKLLQADPEFAPFLATLHGISKMDDPSEEHVPGDGSTNKKKVALAGGLVAGAAAEGLATARAVGAMGKKPYAPKHVRVGNLTRVAHSPGGKKAEAAFQAANLIVGLGAAKEIAGSRKKVSKGVVGHFQPVGNVAANARARKLGLRGAAVAKRGSFELVDLTYTAEISKVNVEKRQVFGWASLSEIDGEPVVDRQGDHTPIDDAEDAAYEYMLTSRIGGDMHGRVSKLDAGPRHTADVIESMVFTPEKLEALGLEPDALPLGWWLGMKIHDDQQWQDVKDGKRTGFSVHGRGTRKEMIFA